MTTPAPPETVASASAVAAAEKARQTAVKYSGEGQKFHVQYLGTQEVSSAKGDAVIADCLKELRMLFKDVSIHLPKVTIALQLNGLTVTDEKSKLETVKVPLDGISYVCLDPGDSSVFAFIVRCSDTISSKGLRLHAFVSHPQTAITFNRCTREVFDFMARLIKAKKKMAAAQEAKKNTQPPESTGTPALLDAGSGQAGVEPQAESTTNQSPQELVQFLGGNSPVAAASEWPEEKREQTVFDEWKELEKELDDIGEGLDIGSPVQQPITSTPNTSPPVTEPPTIKSKQNTTPVPPPSSTDDKELLIMTASGTDPFDNSFFETSLSNGTQVHPPVTMATTTGVAPILISPQKNNDPNVFDNPIFNGGSQQKDSLSSSEAVSPEGKQLMFPSRPRPKGKNLDSLPPISPPAVPEETREVSLSPNAKEEVKSIVANTDPFSPPSLDVFQFPQASSNGSELFQPSPFASNSNASPGYFSPGSAMAQDSIQLVNPLYQSPNTGAVFSPPAPQNPFVVSQPLGAVPMQQAYFAPAPQPQPAMVQQMPLVQPQIPTGFMEPQPVPPVAVGANTFDGPLSFNMIGSPPPTIPQNPPEVAVLMEQRDKMFADLLPKTSHPIPEQKKKFEPEMRRPSQPTLSELQEKKKKEEEEAFQASNSTTATGEDVVDWPSTPFDDLLAPTPFDNPPQSTNTQEAITNTTQDAQVLNFDDFDTAFEKAKDKEQTQPAATNDPFTPTNTAPAPTPITSSPWSAFDQ